MSVPASELGVRVFTRVLAARRIILLVFVVLGALGVYGASRIPDNNAIGSLMVADDPDAKATIAFEKLFPEGVHALLMLETPDPLSAAALQSTDQLEHALGRIPGVDAQSLLTIYRGANPGTTLAGNDVERVPQVRNRNAPVHARRTARPALPGCRARTACALTRRSGPDAGGDRCRHATVAARPGGPVRAHSPGGFAVAGCMAGA